jgi:two-component system sensor histidine kinase RegB
LGLCFLAIGASVISNLIAMSIFPENQRLSDRDAMLTLLFDLAQLSFLLFLTGGLNNPFALLILAPVTISATALTMRSTTILGVLAIVMISLLAYFHVPLTLATGEVLQLPDLFIVGFWIAIAIGIIFLSAYARRITSESHSMSQALLATQMALAREQKLTDLGGVVAAAAHELGTPLATIKLVSTELAEELEGQPQLAEDAQLISSQADRCRDILRSMGRAGKDDLHMRSAPLGRRGARSCRTACEPGRRDRDGFRGRSGRTGGAADHLAQTRDHPWPAKPRSERSRFRGGCVWIDGTWGDGEIRLVITDDGPGFPLDMLGRLGDPFFAADRVRPIPADPGTKAWALAFHRQDPAREIGG